MNTTPDILFRVTGAEVPATQARWKELAKSAS